MNFKNTSVKFFLLERMEPLVLILLAILGGGVFLNTLGNPFVWDDVVYVSNNSHLQNPEYIYEYFTASFCEGAGRALNCAFYRPFVSLSYLFDYVFWGNKPFGYHLTNVMIHVAVVLLFYKIFLVVFKNSHASLIATLFFAVHPVRVESVAVIANRTDPMTSLFLLPSFFFFYRYLSCLEETVPSGYASGEGLRSGEHSISSAPRTGEFEGGCEGYLRNLTKGFKDAVGRLHFGKNFFLSLSSMFFFLAILTKEVAIGLPLLFLFYDLFFARSWQGFKDLVSRWRTYLPYGIFILIYFVARNHALGYGFTQDLRLGEVWVRILTAPAILWDYFRLQLFPFPLSPFHGRPEMLGSSTLGIIWGWIFSGLFFFLLFRIGRYCREILLGGLWFVIFLLPVLDLIPIAWPMASERYSYIPSMGFALAFGFLCTFIYKCLKGDWTYKIQAGFTSALVGILVIFSIMTVMRNRVWGDEIRLWSDAVQKSPDFALGYMNLGLNHQKRGNIKEAALAYEKSLAYDPSNPKLYHNLGSLYEKLGNPLKAGEMYQKLIGQGQAFPETYYNLGSIFQKKGDLSRAISYYQKAIQYKPDYYNAHLWLGRLYSHLGKKDEALAEFKEAIRIFPQKWVPYVEKAEIWRSLGHFPEAQEAYEASLRMFPPERKESREFVFIQNRLKELRSGK